jgi:hypothetical protein
MTDQFAPDVLERMASTKEVRIETRRAPDGPVHKTIIWVVIDDGRAYVRTFRGAGSRWYREALGDQDCALLIGRDRYPLRIVSVSDPTVVEAVSRGFWAKYPRSRSTAAMVRDEVLETTLELLPG